MDRTIWILVVLNTILTFGHHVDHVVRHRVGWPLDDHVTAFTFSLGFYVLIGVGVVLTRRGVVGPGFWSLLAASGFLFIGLLHFSPIAIDPIDMIVHDYPTRTGAAIALTWVALLVLALGYAAVYAGMRWAALRREARLANAAN